MLLKYFLGILIVLILLVSSLFQIGPEEVGVITRFGKYVRKVEPGLKVKFPIIETLYKVAVERQQKEEFGFRTTRPAVKSEYTKVGTVEESLMLTGDLNLADVEWIVQYLSLIHISEPTRLGMISYAVFCLKKKKNINQKKKQKKKKKKKKKKTQTKK